MQKNDQEMGRAKFLKNFIIGFYEFYDYDFNIERFAGINFVIAVTETYFFYIQFYPADCEYFGTSFLKFMSLINSGIAF